MRTQSIFVTFIIAINLLFPTNGIAATATDLINGEFDHQSRAQRIEIAKDTLSYTKQLADYLPSQKPSEIEWLEKERISINKLNDRSASSSRFLQFYESPEFQHQKLSGLLTSIINALECVVNNKVDIKIEMLCWAVASSNMSDESILNDSIRYLVNSGRLPKDIAKRAGLGDATGFAVKYGWYGRGILEYVIIPYLRGDIE